MFQSNSQEEKQQTLLLERAYNNKEKTVSKQTVNLTVSPVVLYPPLPLRPKTCSVTVVPPLY